jgi:hypothetical protein
MLDRERERRGDDGNLEEMREETNLNILSKQMRESLISSLSRVHITSSGSLEIEKLKFKFEVHWREIFVG